MYHWELPLDIEPLGPICGGSPPAKSTWRCSPPATRSCICCKLAEIWIWSEVRAGLAHRGRLDRPDDERDASHNGLPVDFEPSHPKMGHLVSEAAASAGRSSNGSDAPWLSDIEWIDAWRPIQHPASSIQHPVHRLARQPVPASLPPRADGLHADLAHAASGPIHARVPRASASSTVSSSCAATRSCAARSCARRSSGWASMRRSCFPTCCRSSSRWAWSWNFRHGEGPLIHNPVRRAADVDRVVELESAEALAFRLRDGRAKRARDLPAHIPLIGFAGAPFTLASYAIEGGGSRSFLHTKTLMYRDGGAWRDADGAAVAVDRPAISTPRSPPAPRRATLRQLGRLPGRRRLSPVRAAARAAASLAASTPGVPLINFATGNRRLLAPMAEAGGDVIGVDWRVELGRRVARRSGYDRAVQGNLDPAVLLADREAEFAARAAGDPATGRRPSRAHLQSRPRRVAANAGGQRPALVDIVHEASAR